MTNKFYIVIVGMVVLLVAKYIQKVYSALNDHNTKLYDCIQGWIF